MPKLTKALKAEFTEVAADVNGRKSKLPRILSGKVEDIDFAGYPITSLSRSLGLVYVKTSTDNRTVVEMVKELAPEITDAQWATLRNTVLGNANKHLRRTPQLTAPMPLFSGHTKVFDKAHKAAVARREARAKAKAEAQKSEAKAN